MRLLMNVTMPHEPFNTAVRDGSIGEKIERILKETGPEAVYFTEHNGHRGAIAKRWLRVIPRSPFFSQAAFQPTTTLPPGYSG